MEAFCRSESSGTAASLELVLMSAMNSAAVETILDAGKSVFWLLCVMASFPSGADVIGQRFPLKSLGTIKDESVPENKDDGESDEDDDEDDDDDAGEPDDDAGEEEYSGDEGNEEDDDEDELEANGGAGGSEEEDDDDDDEDDEDDDEDGDDDDDEEDDDELPPLKKRKRLEKDLKGGKNHFVEICGLPVSTYFSATKILWLIENVDGIKKAIQAGDALFGTIDSWIIWNLTGGCGSANQVEKLVQGLHVTDCSNASRTMLMNLKTLDWDQTTLEELGIPFEILPKIVSNSETIGIIANGWPLCGIPIAGCLGDQHAAMLGQLCQKGQAKSTYGTGAFILLNTGDEIVQSSHGLLSTLAYKLGPDAQTNYALEGSIAIAGAAVQWLRDGLGIIGSASEIEEMAGTVENTGGVYFVPAFNGLFAPWWRDDARGVCIGITRFTTKGHIARAVLESMCFQVKDVLDSMYKDSGKGEDKSKRQFLLRVDGGATVNNLLMQIQADLLGSSVVRPLDIETTALGAAYAAGLAIGIWTKEQIFSGKSAEDSTIFRPKLNEEQRNKRCDSWCKAVTRTFDLADLSI